MVIQIALPQVCWKGRLGRTCLNPSVLSAPLPLPLPLPLPSHLHWRAQKWIQSPKPSQNYPQFWSPYHHLIISLRLPYLTSKQVSIIIGHRGPFSAMTGIPWSFHGYKRFVQTSTWVLNQCYMGWASFISPLVCNPLASISLSAQLDAHSTWSHL